MIVVQTGQSRDDKAQLQERWSTFGPHRNGSKEAGTPETYESPGIFESLGEGRVPPNTDPRRGREVGEVVTYVREGSLVYQDSTTQHEVIRAGEFHRTTLGPGFHYSETNASTTHWAHIFQIWFAPQDGCIPGHESKRFASADRRHGLCLIASPDGRNGSLTVHQDGYLYSALTPQGRHMVHELAPSRLACLHVVEGAVRVTGDQALRTGDIAVLTGERVVSFFAEEASEVLLLDLIAPKPKNGSTAEGWLNGENLPSE